LRGLLLAGMTPSLCAATGRPCCELPAADEASIRFGTGLVDIDLKRVPELKGRGGAVWIVNDERKIALVVVHLGGREFLAADRKCTHGGGPLTFLAKRRVLHCTCWGHSRFALDGSVVAGPAKRKLNIYETAREGDRLTIRLGTPA